MRRLMLLTGAVAMVASATLLVGAPAAVPGRVSARLSKSSFTAAEAGNVKLVCTFSPASSHWGYVLSLRKGATWANVRSVDKTGSFRSSSAYSMTIKQLFGPKAVNVGQYRVKVLADANSVTLGFKVVKATSGGGAVGSPVSRPVAGHWEATSLSGPVGEVKSVYFDVLPDQATVAKFGFVYDYHAFYCSGTFVHSWIETPSAIVGGQFQTPNPSGSWSTTFNSPARGSGTFNGSFDAPTSARGTAQLTTLVFCRSGPGGGQTLNSGTFSWTARFVP